MKNRIGVLLTVACVCAAGAAAFAATPAPETPKKEWREHHPLQDQVLQRNKRERARIRKLYKQGKITKAQRNEMLAQTKDVAQEDRADAKATGGGITKGEQKVMNHQQDAIGREMKTDAAAPAPAPAP